MSLYHDLILDHYRNPRHHGELQDATHHGAADNPTCGDRLQMDIRVKNGKIEDIRFTGAGCAISQAAASLLAETANGKTVTEMLTFEPNAVLKLLGVPLSPNRLKCGLLSLETLKQAFLKS